jgi:hypothetical protein
MRLNTQEQCDNDAGLIDVYEYTTLLAIGMEWLNNPDY